MRKIKLFFFLFVSTLYVNATIYYVSPQGTAGNNGLSWATAFPSLVDAESKVTASDQIWVQQGTYNVNDATLTMKNGVNVYGGFAGTETTFAARSTNAALTILNGNNTQRVVSASADITVETIWDGFTIQNGNAGTAGTGGGVLLLNNTTLKNCIVQNNKNSTSNGGGVYMASNATDSVKLVNCVVKNNIVYYNGASTSATTPPNGGGGVYMHIGSFAGVIRGCTIESNIVNCVSTASPGVVGGKMYGGGVFLCDGTIENSTISSNRATGFDLATPTIKKTTGEVHGGGVFVMPGLATINIQIKNCNITGNSSEIKQGGGMVINPFWINTPADFKILAKVSVKNCIITNNYSRTQGGGVFCDSQAPLSKGEYTFENCVIANNYAETLPGAGAFLNNMNATTTIKFANCTVVNNSTNSPTNGGGAFVYTNSPTDITNCIFWGNRHFATVAANSNNHHVKPKAVTGNKIINCSFDAKLSAKELLVVGLPIYPSTTPSTDPATLTDTLRMSLLNTGVAADSLYIKFVSPTNFLGIAKTAADLVSLSQANWALTGTSSCIKKGRDISPLATTDIIGNLRPVGAFDIGAYQFKVLTAVKQTIENLSTIYSIPGAVLINNLDDLKQASVYTLMGSLVKNVALAQGVNTITLPAKQLYIVKAGNTAKKVLVN